MKKANPQLLLPIVVLIFAIALVTAVFGTGCSGAPAAEGPIAMQPANLEPTAVIPTPTEETAVLPTATPEPVDECLICHVNKDELIQTADPVEEVISENEGEG